MKYPKIETLYNRDKDTFRVVPSEFRKPEFALINTWFVTEKVDGRNHRVMLFPDGHIEHRGRTDNAQFANFMLEGARATIDEAAIYHTIQPDEDGQYPMTVFYGELYGPKIQGGGKYSDQVNFRLFDIRIGDWWMEWDAVEDFANALGVKTVPVIGDIDWVPTCLAELWDLFEYDGLSKISSLVALADKEVEYIEPEGIVARTRPLLFDRRGGRIMWKLKMSDWG